MFVIIPGAIAPLSGNILQLQQPNEYSCKVTNYVESHSVMYVHIVAKNAKRVSHINYYLSLKGVDYFEGPLGWDSAELMVCGLDEFYAVISDLYPEQYPPPVEVEANKSIPLEKEPEPVFMYRFRSSTRPVRIIARGSIRLSVEPFNPQE